MPRDYYVVLGVSRDADPGQIRKAHRRLVRLYHPDTDGGCTERFCEIQEAYETLSDDEARRRHDAQLPEPPEAQSSPERRPPPVEPLRCRTRPAGSTGRSTSSSKAGCRGSSTGAAPRRFARTSTWS
ncbi:MAG: J domain-containing protein [Polyangia bacterium]